mmetsp:Transcript_7564/g.19707  ORF Transcript_7564/g.19707 Transcript_7564/m.19707 type:complete len:372 (+) Transcript_7564:67-1182(+)|eukprot:CAMPEP_0197427542 /NCGR_PEP_ID=MMETSP1170-20131217/38570_1 /TAXON_ID=54406 /ORGANISM="Sarcinochrysis sp, Strain CCMP770" /LENGTH=371 /DNA_ID=CAMNT_0042955237 /DNA_START=54 /DNA_END=1169 /DNA_ORIENTATION=+
MSSSSDHDADAAVAVSEGTAASLPEVKMSTRAARMTAEERRWMLWRLRMSLPLAEVLEGDEDWDGGPLVEATTSGGGSELAGSWVFAVPGVAEMLAGTRDERSPLAKLAGNELALRKIAMRIAELETKRYVEVGGVFAAAVGRVRFPTSRGLRCNMMPIVLGRADTIPEEFRGYIPLLTACPIARRHWNKVGYLTVDESDVDPGRSQRRPGLHCEAPTLGLSPGATFAADDSATFRPITLAWGRGVFLKGPNRSGHFDGGLFMASTVDHSCRVFNCRPTDDAPRGLHGDLDDLRPLLPGGFALNAGTLVWLTDQAPHESLPLPAKTHRQFFRLVTPNIDVWYVDHSTPNPLGVTPPEGVTILAGSKFARAG